MKKNNQKYKPQQNKKTITISKKRNTSLLPIIIAFCLPVLLYIQTINFKFTHFDDDVIIINNAAFLGNIGNAQQAFHTDAFMKKTGTFYRPLQTLSYMTDMQLSGGNNPWMYHLTNILLLGFISCSLFLLLRRFSIPPKLALLGALIYCAHPLFVSSVAWLPARGDLLLTLFSVLSFLFFIEFLEKKKNIYLFLNWAAFTIALFCKETAAILPLLFIIYFFTFSAKNHFEKKYLFIILLYAVSGIFWFCLRFNAIGNYTNPNNAPVLLALQLNLRTIPEALSKFFLPIFFAPVPIFSVLKTLAGLVIIALIIFLFFKNEERSRKEKIFCFSWFLILMFPPMLFKGPLDYFDHRFFLPLIGILLFILFLIPAKWLKNGDVKRVWVLVVIFVLLSSFTFIKSQTYSAPMTFYNSAISHNSDSAPLYNNRGYLKYTKNDFPEAIKDYDIAISINEKYADAYYNKGIAEYCLNNYKGAIENYKKAVSIRPKYAKVYNDMGIALGSIGDLREAIISFDKAIEIDPKFPDTYFNRALAKYYSKDYAGSIEDCEKYLILETNNEKALKLKTAAMKELQKIK